MMRVDLPASLTTGRTFQFYIDWNYYIQDQPRYGGRGGYEYFEDTDNYLYEIAQWFPRMCVYDDVNGWQNKQFLGRGEFALAFGNYKVAITVPEDHVVCATGMLQNSKEVLSAVQQERLSKAYQSFDTPVLIVTEDEAREAEKNSTGWTKKTKTWVYTAENVRDFAFASSRKFIWDAMGVKVGTRTVLAQSLYPKEGNPLWGKYSTQAVAHTLRVYSKHTIPYPYPQCASIHGPVFGMEYPMLSFNGGRPKADGTYDARTKYSMISVIIHEVGHNWFPMIINSDERQWTWLDEGLNTFMQFIAEREWEREYPSRRGFPQDIVPYMSTAAKEDVPIMTNSESILRFGDNAYGKPATALNILRETILGRELFDYAFKKYCERWAFKHPMPADLFRTLEDATGIDLDWFWRGWFYTTDHVDIAISNVDWYRVDTRDPRIAAEFRKAMTADARKHPTIVRNLQAIQQTLVEKYPDLADKYTNQDPFEVTQVDLERFESYMESLSEEMRKLISADKHYYEVTFENLGGLVMPLVLEFTFTDNTTQQMRLPAEVWRQNNKFAHKVFIFDKPLKQIRLDPNRETADTDLENNYFPRRFTPKMFRVR
jgi:hypothetical protein